MQYAFVFTAMHLGASAGLTALLLQVQIFITVLLAYIIETFHHRHKELYTYDERDNKVELVNIEVAIIGRISKPKLPVLAQQQGDINQAKVGSRAMIMDQDYEWIDTPIYNGEAFGAGAFIAGPALIQEPTTTIVIKKGWQAELHETGTYKLTKAA